MKTSPNKKIPQTSDWIQVEIESNSVGINMNLVEEIIFYPDIAGEPAMDIHYASGRQRQIRGKKAEAFWKLINQGVTFEFSKS